MTTMSEAVKPSLAYWITQRTLRSARLEGARSLPATTFRCAIPKPMRVRRTYKALVTVCQGCQLVIDDQEPA